MTYGQRLLHALAHAEMSRAQLAREIGITVQAIGGIVNGTTKALTAENNHRAAVALGVSPGWLATGEGAMVEDRLAASGLRRVPIVGTAKMGDDGFYEEISPIPGAGDGYLGIATTDPNAYGLRLKGMSMFPAIRDGWYAVVEPNRNPTVGEYVLVKLRDGRKMVKELLFERGANFELLSVNGSERFAVEKGDLENIQAIGPIVPPSAWQPD